MKLVHALFAAALLATPALPCSAFFLAAGGKVLFANNEDFWDPDTYVWFVPAEGERRGVMYLGYGNGFPQGGMNDAGLAFDGFATGTRPLTQQDGKRAFAGNPINEALETCTTVEEVVAFLESVDLRPLLSRAMLFFADATGDSVIVEGDTFLRKKGDYQVITNFYQSDQEDDLAQCARYASAVQVLEARTEASLAVCTEALSASAQRGRKVATLYSNVFDLEARTMHLYLFHDFEHPVVLDLDDELEKGAHKLYLPELFPANKAFEHYAAYQRMSIEERIASRKGSPLPADVLEAATGDYSFSVEGTVHPLRIRRAGDGLVAECSVFKRTGEELELHAVSSTEFFAVTHAGEVVVTFHLEGESVRGFTFDGDGKRYEATRD